MKRILIASLLCLGLSGCLVLLDIYASPTPEQRQELVAAQDALAGNYVVVDSRLDFLQIESVTVIPQKGKGRFLGPAFIFHLKNGEILQFRVNRCMENFRSTKNICWTTSNLMYNACSGHHSDNSKYESVACAGNFRGDGYSLIDDSPEIGAGYYISFALINKASLVMNSKNLPPFTNSKNLSPYPPMKVKPGDYTMSISIGTYSYTKQDYKAMGMMIRPTTDGPAQYVLKRSTPDKSDAGDTSATQKAQTAQNTAKAPKTNDTAASVFDGARAAAGAVVGGSTGTGE